MGYNYLEVLMGMLSAARLKNEKENMKALQTIIGDLQRISKDYISQEQLISYINSQFKANEKSLNEAKRRGVAYTPDYTFLSLLVELKVDFGYQLLTEDEIFRYFFGLCTLNPGINKGQMMRALKAEFSGKYDGIQASIIASKVFENFNCQSPK